MTDIVTVDITGVLDPNDLTGSDPDESGPAINFDGLADLTSATLAGNFASVDVQNNGNIETLIITANVNNGDIDIDTNSDLETITLTGAKATGVIVNANNSLVNLTVDATYVAGLGTSDTLDGSIAVTDNTDLETLVLKGTNVSVLTVTGNVDLETITATELTTLGATAASNNVTISGNKFSASVAQDKTNATSCTSCADLEANDLGAFTTTSGMNTLKTYLALVAANTSAVASVYFDTVESTTNATGVEQTGETTGQNDTTVILAKNAASGGVAAKGEIAARRAFVVDVSVGGSIGLEKGGVSLFSDGTTASTAGSITISTNLDLLVADIKSAANVARFDAYDISLDAARGGNSTQTVSLVSYVSGGSTATVLGQRYTSTTANAAAVSSTNYGFGIDDTVTLTVGGNSVTVSPNTGGGTSLNDLGVDIVAAWAAKYGTSGTASSSAIATVTNSAGILTITMLDIGTAGYAVDVDFAVGVGTVTATNAKNIDFVIGTTRLESDDATVDTDVVITLTSDDTGTILDQVSGVTSSGSALVELTTNKLTNATDPGAADQPSSTRSADAINAEDGVAAVAPTTAASNKTRVHWLGA
jgi:hypothetical protein